MKARLSIAAMTAPMLIGASGALAHDGEKLGTVRFPTSCAPTVQADFERAVALPCSTRWR